MYWSCALVLLIILGCTTADQALRGTAKLEHDWAEAFKVIITVDMQYPVPNGWRMALIFSNPIKKIDVWRAKVIATKDQRTYSLKNMVFNPSLAKGQQLTMAVVAYKAKKNQKPGNVTVLFKGGNQVPTLPPPTPEQEIVVYPRLKPIDESDSGFKMIISYRVPAIVTDWRLSLKFTKPIRTRPFNIDKAKVALTTEQQSDTFCLGPWPYNQNLKANSTLRLEFSCNKAKLYEAAPDAFFMFHPNTTKCEDFDAPTLVPGPASPKENTDAELVHTWSNNEFKMRFDLQVINSVRGGWKISLKFSETVAAISNLAQAKLVGKSNDKLVYYIQNSPGQIQNANLKQCSRIKVEFAGKLQAAVMSKPLTARVFFERKEPEYMEINPDGACPTALP